MAKYLVGTSRDSLSIALCNAIGIEPGMVSRIIVDLQVAHPARVYYETYGDDEKLAVAFGADLRIVDREEDA